MKIHVKFLILAFVITTSLSCSKDNLSLPQGWRMPLRSEISDDWRKKDFGNYLFVKGDFNGDGVIDEARLLVREDGSGLALFAFISQENQTFKVYLLDEMKGLIAIHTMGIKKVSQGLYKTACGKGYWKCRKDEVPEILIQHDAIDYFKIESANSYFYMDVKENTFKRIWISD